MTEIVELLSDVSSDAEREHDADDHEEVMDPSDPRAHGRATLQRVAAHANGKSRWDSDSEDGGGGATGSDMAISSESEEDEEEVDEDLGERVDIQVDEDDDDDNDGTGNGSSESTPAPAIKAKLSNWAISRFLVPRKDRKIPELEEPPLEPLNDYILSDFGSRFRGATGNVETQKRIEEDDDASDQDDEQARLDAKFQVGAPLFSTTDSKDQAASKEEAKTTDDKAAAQRKRRENRYFVTDLATKCFNCGQVGHVSNMCANDKVHKPCYYCGMRGHNTYACPHLPCSVCLQLGHEARDCTNRRLTSRSCSLCGRSGHDQAHCRTEHSPRDVSCMVCLAPGHLHCAPIPPPADRRVYCPHCAGNHALRYCRDYVEPIVSSFTARPPRADMKCFLCNKPGHIAAECPQRSGYNGGNSCFNCGERGHYASDCPAGNNGGGRGGNNGGRKRSRHDRFVEMNDDDDDSHYYEVPGHQRNTKRARTSNYSNSSSNSHSNGGSRYRHISNNHSNNGSSSSRRRR